MSFSVLTFAAVSLITALVTRTSIGSSKPSLTMVSLTDEPTGPRIISTASDKVRPSIGLSSTNVIKSPANTPALKAGVSSIGDTTFTKPSC